MNIESITTKGFRTLLNYPDDFHFDLVIYDFSVSPCLLPFLHKFKYPPLVGVSAYSNPSYSTEVIGGHKYYAYIPHNMVAHDDHRSMTFWQRILNFAFHLEEKL